MDKKYIIGCGIGLLIIVIYIIMHNLNKHTKNIHT